MRTLTVVVVSVFNIVSIYALTWVAPEYDIETGPGGPLPYPCCYPVQFEATLGPQSGFPEETVPGVLRTDVLLSYDLPGKKWGFRARQIYATGGYRDMFMVEDYRKRTQSYWYSGKCTTIPLNTTVEMKQPLCIPRKKARYSGILRQGWKNESPIRHISWRWRHDKDWFFYVTVLQHKCIPVSETAFIKTPRSTVVTNIDFYDFKTGLSEVPIFEQFSQADCKLTNKHMEQVDGPLTPEHEHLRKRFTSQPGDKEEEGVATVVIEDDPAWQE